MTISVTAQKEDFFTIDDFCYDCWRVLLFSNDKHEVVDAILNHLDLHDSFEKLCTFDRCGGATCSFCSLSTLPAAESVKDDVSFVPNVALRTISLDEWPLDELFLRISSITELQGHADKNVLNNSSVSRGFNLGVLAVYFARTFGKDKKYPVSFAKKCITIHLTDNVVSHVRSIWKTKLTIAADFTKKLAMMGDPNDELNKLILTYFNSHSKPAEISHQEVLDIYKKRLKEVVIELLENEFDTFVSEYQELFKYIDRIYYGDRLLFEQLLRLRISVTCDLQERLKFTSFQISRDVMTFTGFYNKYARGLSQTAWSLKETLKQNELSVEDCLCAPLQDICQGDGYKFMASGREDCDVRTTGAGRKFCVEIYNCKRDPFYLFQIIRMLGHNNSNPYRTSLNEVMPIIPTSHQLSGTSDITLDIAGSSKEYYFLQRGEDKLAGDINTIKVLKVPKNSLLDVFSCVVDQKADTGEAASAARFYGLRLVFESKTERQAIQKDAENKCKMYSCVVYSCEEVTFEELEKIPKGSITIKQCNPIRTSHRKSQCERKRIIHEISIDLIHPRLLLIHLKTQAGTYVKEFVSGDIGRTTPSISSFLGDKRLYVTHLDVVDFS